MLIFLNQIIIALVIELTLIHVTISIRNGQLETSTFYSVKPTQELTYHEVGRFS